MNEDFFARTPHQGLLQVTGRDAARFLQGYVTCDMEEMVPERWRLGAFCNLQGRMVSSFRIVQTGDGYLLNMAEELVPVTIAFLRKYIPFFKAEMNDVSGSLTLIGIAGSSGRAAIEQAGGRPAEENGAIAVAGAHRILQVNATPDEFEWWAPAPESETVEEGLRKALREERPERWRLLEIELGLGWVSGETSEEFVPQMMNFQLVDGISFTKGCYLGQEIVARMEYRGQLKRSMVRARAEARDTVVPGADLLDDSGKRVGTVVSAASAGDHLELLAVVQRSEAPMSCHLASGVAIALLPLPYTAWPANQPTARQASETEEDR